MSETSKTDNYEFEGIGLGTKEKRQGEQLFEQYRNKYHIENFSDLQLLSELVFREIIQERYKKKIAKLAKSDKLKDSETIPKYLVEALNENLEQILLLKDKLGLFQEKKDDEYKAFEVLEKKFNVWKDEHIEERKVTCIFCSKIFFLNIRTDKYQESKLKLFKNKILCNSTLWEMYKGKKITKEEFAKILNVSENYIDWLEEKIYNSPSK